jgi:hypothetical protein
MSSLTNVNYAPYSRDGLNLKSALGANVLHRTRHQGSLVGKGFDLLNQNLMDREDKKIETETTLKSQVVDHTKPFVGIMDLGGDDQKTVLGGKIGMIVSKLI